MTVVTYKPPSTITFLQIVGFLGLVFKRVKLSRKVDTLRDESMPSVLRYQEQLFLFPSTPEQFSPKGGRGDIDV